jgi:hypothetical protein
MAVSFACWDCGTLIEDEPLPLGRESRCRTCEHDLHVCRQCTFYDTAKAKRCAEPVADEVRDKERSNFCGYFVLNMQAHQDTAPADEARDKLAAMFGLNADAGDDNKAFGDVSDAQALQRQRQDEVDEAKQALSKLFGVEDDDQA